MTATDELLLDTPATRPCVHRRVHRHGTLQRYRLDRCRCAHCRAANTDYLAHRLQLIAYGRWSAFVDARPVRAHVLDLLDSGMSRQGIAERARVSQDTVRRLTTTDVLRMRRRTASALLDLEIGRRRAGQRGLWDS